MKKIINSFLMVNYLSSIFTVSSYNIYNGDNTLIDSTLPIFLTMYSNPVNLAVSKTLKTLSITSMKSV